MKILKIVADTQCYSNPRSVFKYQQTLTVWFMCRDYEITKGGSTSLRLFILTAINVNLLMSVIVAGTIL